MFIKDLQLVNFRNFRRETLQLKKGITVLQGANGQGKSNLLEAIYHLCLGKSFRTLKESDMVYWEQPYFLQGHVFQKLYKVENGYESEKGRKVVKINGRLLKKEEFVKFSPVVFVRRILI